MFNILKQIPSTTVDEVLSNLDSKGVALIDVRSSGEFASGHAKGAINIPLETISNTARTLSIHERVFVICQSGGRSSIGARILSTHGVNAVNVSGGTNAWRMAGLPME